MEVEFHLRVLPLKRGGSYADIWNSLVDRVAQDRHLATKLDDELQMRRAMNFVPEVHELIEAAMLFLLEAKMAHDANDADRAWAALVRCNYYLGTCSSHATRLELTALGGRITGSRIVPLRNMVVEMLKAMPDNSRATKQDLWAEILPAMQTFGGDHQARSTNPRQLLQRWTNHDPAVHPQFARVVEGSLNTRARRKVR
ncbi:TPA: hypothetical protein RNS97_001043 [Stenotrophomonas maltophilia]|nr:hypothetical protein [Stenotrophomonas maltophilia]HDX0845790.1 hypothetical protein [Stenotrophomonas maltophilia]